MTKRVKTSLLIALTALLLLCAGILLFPARSAKADHITITTTSDENFSFVPGADLDAENFQADWHELQFKFKLDHYAYENLSSLTQYGTYWWWNERADNLFIYEFTLCRLNGDGDGQGNLGTAEEEFSVLVVIWTDSNLNFYGYIAEKNYYYGSSFWAGTLLPGTYLDNTEKTENDYIATNGRTFNIDGVNKRFGQGYTVTRKRTLKNGHTNLNFIEDNGLVALLYANVSSPFSNYMVRARYYYQYTTTRNVYGSDWAQVYGDTDSLACSVAGVLQDYSDQDVDFNEYFGDSARADYANEILRSNNVQRVKIKYLTEIEGTPYATHNFAYVNVPVLRDTIYIADVEKALDISLHKCLESNAYCFQKEIDATEGEYYRLYYLRNIWLRSITVDGRYMDYFLDINNSYKDVYRQYVDSGILDDGAYEWVYSTQFLNKYPALQNYRFNEVYGYFGLIAIPETYTLNTVFKKMFDISTSKVGVVSNFSFAGTLPKTAYENLLRDYNYGFLETIWAEYANFHPLTSTTNAQFYVIYSEPGTGNAWIDDSGGDDPENPDGVLPSQVKDGIGIFLDVWGTVLNGVVGILKGAGNHLTEILIIAAIIAGVILLFKFGIIGGNKRRRK